MTIAGFIATTTPYARYNRPISFISNLQLLFIYMLSQPALIRISVCLILLSLVNWSFMGLLLKGIRGFGAHLSLTSNLSRSVAPALNAAQSRPFSLSKKKYAMVISAFASPLSLLVELSSCGANCDVQDKKDSILNWVAPSDKSGEFKRQQSVFRSHIENKPGAEFPAEKDRYHLYVSYACPWAHRTLIVRKLKGLEDIIGVTSVHWHMGEKGKLNIAPCLKKGGLLITSCRMALCNCRRQCTGRERDTRSSPF